MCTGMTSFNQPDGWISVQDRLPDDGKELLVYEKYFGYFVAAYNDGYWTNFLFNNPEVTHWRELPDPPRMEEK